MPTFRRPLAAIAAAALIGAAVAVPAGADPWTGPRTRSITHATVLGSDGGTPQARPSSFERFTRGRSPLNATTAPAVPATRTPVIASTIDLIEAGGFLPSDTTGAMGQVSIVAAVNVQTAVYSAATGAELVAPVDLESLHPDGNGHFNFDPKVVYDAYADTHVLAWLVQDDAPQVSSIIVAAIPDATAADTSTWCVTSLPGDAVPSDSARWADYPGLGFTEGRLVISTNQFTFPSSNGRFRYAQLLSMNKSVYDCDQPLPPLTVFAGTQTRDANGIQAFTIQPAQTVGGPATDQYLLSFQLAGKFSYLAIWRLRDTATGLKLKKGVISVGKTAFPPAGTQGGGSLNDADTFWDAGDERLINAFYDADTNRLYAAHAVRRNFKPDTVTGGYPESAARWYEVIPANKPVNSVLNRKGTIGEAEVDVGWPSVATDDDGNLYVTYSRASAPFGEFLSAWVADIAPGSRSDSQVLMKAGLATYDTQPGIERWGDYTAINRDPTQPSNVAAFNQYAIGPVDWQQVFGYVT